MEWHHRSADRFHSTQPQKRRLTRTDFCYGRLFFPSKKKKHRAFETSLSPLSLKDVVLRLNYFIYLRHGEWIDWAGRFHSTQHQNYFVKWSDLGRFRSTKILMQMEKGGVIPFDKEAFARLHGMECAQERAGSFHSTHRRSLMITITRTNCDTLQQQFHRR